jgi:hypothetical protein
MTVAPIAARAAVAEGAGSTVARQGAGKVVDAKVISSKPLHARNVRSKAASGAATGAGAAAGGAGGSKLVDGGMLGKGTKAVADTVAPTSAARKVLLAEFCSCMVVLAFSPLTGKSPSAGAFMKRGSAIMGVFFLLGLVATAGRGAARASAAFGGLVTLVLLVSDRSIFTVLAKKLGKGVGESDASDGLDAQDLADAGTGVGQSIADLSQEIADTSPLGDAAGVTGGTGTSVGQLGAASAEDLAALLARYGVR